MPVGVPWFHYLVCCSEFAKRRRERKRHPSYGLQMMQDYYSSKFCHQKYCQAISLRTQKISSCTLRAYGLLAPTSCCSLSSWLSKTKLFTFSSCQINSDVSCLFYSAYTLPPQQSLCCRKLIQNLPFKIIKEMGANSDAYQSSSYYFYSQPRCTGQRRIKKLNNKTIETNGTDRQDLC